MVPTLLVGDLILRMRVPLRHSPAWPTKSFPATTRSAVMWMVFRYPPKPSLDYIKRVSGVPGDEVTYLNKKLTINAAKPVETTALDGILRRRNHALFPCGIRKKWATIRTVCW